MAAPRVPITDLPEQTNVVNSDLLVVQNGVTTKKMLIGRLATQITDGVNAHVTDTTAAHAATAIGAIPNSAPMTGTDVQGQLTQAATRLAQLTNVDNTSDASKPISAATQTALNAKADASSTTTALNLKADKTTAITTTAPLAGGGDLSAARTLTVADFTPTVRGTVPASGGGTANYLRADGQWVPITITGSAPIRRTVQYSNAAAALVLTPSDENTTIMSGYPIANTTCALPSMATTAFPIGAEVEFVNNAPGGFVIVFSAGAGATVQSKNNWLKTGVASSLVVAKKISNNGWLLYGDLAA